jgi:putative nucleotidyltransferase with HDIG domain
MEESMEQETQYNFEEMKQEMDELKQRLEILNVLFEISKNINSSIELKKTLKNILSSAMTVMQAKKGSVMLLDPDDEILRPEVAVGINPEVMENITIKLGEGIAGKVAESGEPLLVRHKQNSSEKYESDSFLCVPLKIKDKIIGIINITEPWSGRPFNDHDLHLLIALGAQASISIENARLYSTMEEIYINTIAALAAAIDAKDSYTHGHSERVTHYSIALAETLNLSEMEIKLIKQAAILHDVGKIGIADSILCKPGKLSDDEFLTIRTHPDKGSKIINKIKFMGKIDLYIRHHHERYDGTGYPDKLKGKNIPLGARIISISDTFDAMTSTRSYRKALSIEIAKNELIRCKGTQFDPELVDIFVSLIEKDQFSTIVPGLDID